MREASDERVEEEVVALARGDALDEPLARAGQRRPASLQLEQRAHEGEFRRVVDAVLRARDHQARALGEQRGQRHLAAGPARDDRGARRRGPHPRGHLAHAHELEHAAGEDEAVARRQARDERLLDVAERLAVLHAHGDARLRDDGADLRAMAARDLRIGHARDAVLADHHAAVLRVGVEARAAVRDEVERPAPVVVGERAVGVRRAHLGEERFRLEAAAQRAGDEVLHQHVERPVERDARLDHAFGGRLARGGGLDQLERVRRQHGDARDLARPVAAAAGALQQARDALRAADLDAPGRRARSRRRGRGSTCRRPRAACLRAGRPRPSRAPRARASRGAARSCPAQCGRASRIAWYQISVDERTLVKTSVERADSIARITSGSSFNPMWPAQGKRSSVRGLSVAISTVLRLLPADEPRRPAARAGPTSAAAACGEVGERGGQSPGAQRRAVRAQPRERQFDLHAALAAEQLVPLVDDDRVEVREAIAPVGAREQQRQALGRRDERGGQPLVLLRARGRRRVAGARVDRPVRLQRLRGARERERRVGRERAQRRDPDRRRAAAGRPPSPSGPSASGPSHAASVLPMPVGAWTSPDSPRA